MTYSVCWLCRADKPVLFIGPLTVNGRTAPGFACADCCTWSDRYVCAYLRMHDAGYPLTPF
ncbi:hypothetical protein AB0O01_04245 [Streptomyces sp. NPDC093252]|uniref:hypothetical protein n=1 Tax=Streptomyces sp. NPDC093252 TaxID=3154980 RepID=UPI0034368704